MQIASYMELCKRNRTLEKIAIVKLEEHKAQF